MPSVTGGIRPYAPRHPVGMSVGIREIGVITRRDLFVLAGAYRMRAGANLGC